MKTSKFTVDGLKFEVSLEDSELAEKKNGEYERESIDWFIEKSDEIDLFIDVGAFCGSYGLYMYDQGVPVVAFEPSQEAYQSLQNNYSRNDNGTEYLLVNKAVANEEKEMAGGVGNCYFFEGRSNLNGRGTQHVQTTTLEDELGKVQMDGNSVLGLKIDTEGMELSVLEGIGPYIDQVQYMCVEFHPSYVTEEEISNTVDLIHQHGFDNVDDKTPFYDNPTIRYVRK